MPLCDHLDTHLGLHLQLKYVPSRKRPRHFFRADLSFTLYEGHMSESRLRLVFLCAQHRHNIISLGAFNHVTFKFFTVQSDSSCSQVIP